MPTPFCSELQEDIGEQVRLLRTARGLSQRQLGKLAGMDQIRVSRLETGVPIAYRVSTLERIARVLGTKLVVMFVEPEELKPVG